MHLKQSRGNNSEDMKATVVIWYATHCHDLFYITVKCHDHIPKVTIVMVVVVVVLLFYVRGKHLRSCRDGQLT